MQRTQEQIDARFEALKKKHPNLVCIQVFASAEDEQAEAPQFFCAFLNPPKRQMLEPILQKVNAGHMVDATEMILNSCGVEVDDEVTEQDDVFYGVMAQINAVLEVRAALVKKS